MKSRHARGKSLSILTAAALTLLLGFLSPTPAAAQRLCENSDNAVATISPCTGPTGTTITLTMKRTLSSPPKTLLFKRVVANGVPAQVIVPLAGLSATAPAQLCTGGSGRWEVWLVDDANKSQGQIGAYWPDCRAVPPTPTPVGPSPGPGPGGRLCEASDTAVASISPCTGPSGTTITITVRRQLKSAPAALLFKRMLTNGVPAQFSVPISGLKASSPPQLCTTGGNGRWEVWLIDANGTSQGFIGAFWPDCGGSDPCLVGTWVSDSVTRPSKVAPKRGGGGIQLVINTSGLATITYTGMQPIEQLDVGGHVMNTTLYTGTASAFISAKDGLLTVGTVKNSGLTSKITDTRTGRTTGGALSGLGDVFYGGGRVAGYNLNYTCSGGTFVIQHSVGPNEVIQVITFKRK